MNTQDQISSYIDSELTPEQEQEFLISLAASEGLRKTFRSELVLKKVLHKDELHTAPPRNLRSAVFATLGIAALSATPTSSEASSVSGTVAQHVTRSAWQSFIAAKGSAVITTLTVALAAVGGFIARPIISPEAQPTMTHYSQPRVHKVVNHASVSEQPNQSIASGVQENAVPVAHKIVRHHHRIAKALNSSQVTPTVRTQDVTTSGAMQVSSKPPVINGKDNSK